GLGSVVRGLDPRIHLLQERWIAGSSPAMTGRHARLPLARILAAETQSESEEKALPGGAAAFSPPRICAHLWSMTETYRTSVTLSRTISWHLGLCARMSHPTRRGSTTAEGGCGRSFMRRAAAEAAAASG